MDLTPALQHGRTQQDNSLAKTFEFEDFINAMAFVHKVAVSCEDHNHHADIDIRRNKVTLVTTTHDAGSVITQKDLDLIDSIETI